MERAEIPSGNGYFNLDILLQFENFSIDVVSILHEMNCISFTGYEEDLFHLSFYKDGKITVTHAGDQHLVLPKTFLFNSPKMQHSEKISEENITKYHIYFNVIPKRVIPKKFLNYMQQEHREILNLISRQNTFEFVKDQSKMVNSIFERIVYELDHQKFGHNLLLHTLFTEIFILFCRSINNAKFSYRIPVVTPTVNSLSYKIASFIAQHYDTITLNEIAETFKLSQRQIQRIIKTSFNTTFKKKLFEIRVQNAKILLKDSTYSILDIANEVGFTNTSYFSKIFREFEQMTPNQYRKQVK
ncbi:MAG: helix-turn-helix transcriptional regulator [Clostridia bacterium]